MFRSCHLLLDAHYPYLERSSMHKYLVPNLHAWSFEDSNFRTLGTWAHVVR